MINYCQVLLSFILQSEDYDSTNVNKNIHNELSYIPKDYNGHLKVEARLSSYGKKRYLVTFIAFLGKNQAIKNGYYPVFLYYRKNKKLILAYGLSAKNHGDTWDFDKLGIITPNTIGQEFGTNKHVDSYDASYVHSVYDVSDVVSHFRNIDVTDDLTYQNEAVKDFGFESKFNFDADLQDICDKYMSLFGLPGIPSSGGTPGPSAGITPSGTPPMDPAPDVAYPRNIILFGPPGTGKTYNTVRYAVAIIKGCKVEDVGEQNDVKKEFDSFISSGLVVFTTFHQSLSYEDFIEGIKPKINEDKTTDMKTVYYDKEPGLFKQICENARGKKEKYILIIDEINRGNVAQIFGELITLIEEDKREGADNQLWCKLPYTGDRFTVPNNLYIIGTMNTADKSVEALDSALRRRFHFIEMMPNDALVPDFCKKYFKTINERISVLKDFEHQIGHSYFIRVDTNEKLWSVFRYNVIPLLQEYFFGDIERIRMVLGDGFIIVNSDIHARVFPKYKGDVDYPTTIMRLWNEKEWEDSKTNDYTGFTEALNKLIEGVTI